MQFVERPKPQNYFARYNKSGETSEQNFANKHEKLFETSSKWMKSTAEICSVIAALIATVAFYTIHGIPTFETHVTFHVFTMSSLIALSFSITSLLLFLAILTSHFTEKGYRKDFAVETFVWLVVALCGHSLSAGFFLCQPLVSSSTVTQNDCVSSVCYYLRPSFSPCWSSVTSLHQSCSAILCFE